MGLSACMVWVQAEEDCQGDAAFEAGTMVEGPRNIAAAAAAAEDAAVADLKARVLAGQRGRADDARRATKVGEFTFWMRHPMCNISCDRRLPTFASMQHI